VFVSAFSQQVACGMLPAAALIDTISSCPAAGLRLIAFRQAEQDSGYSMNRRKEGRIVYDAAKTLQSGSPWVKLTHVAACASTMQGLLCLGDHHSMVVWRFEPPIEGFDECSLPASAAAGRLLEPW
jgi:hypothetical protein